MMNDQDEVLWDENDKLIISLKGKYVVMGLCNSPYIDRLTERENRRLTDK